MGSVDSENTHTMSSGHRKRRFFAVVDRAFQWKYASLVAAMGMALVSAMGLLLYSSHVENTSLLLLERNPELLLQVQAADRLFLGLLSFGIVVVGLVLLAVGLLVTHRMSGPLFIARRYLLRLGKGNYPEIRELRKGDEFQDFFETLNRTVAQLQARDTEQLRKIEDILAQLKRQETNPNHEALVKIIDQVATLRDGLQRTIR